MKKKGYATALVMLMSLGAPVVAHAAEDPNLQLVNSSQGVETVDKNSSSTQTQTTNSPTVQNASQSQSTNPIASQEQQTGNGATQQNQNTDGSTTQTQNINGSGTGSESQTQGTTSSTHLGQTTNQACTDNPGQNETAAVNTNQTQSVSTTSSALNNQTQTSTLGTGQSQTTNLNGGTVQQNQATTVGATQSQNVTTQTGTVHQNQNESLGMTQSQSANTTGSSTVQQNQTSNAQTSQSQASTGYLGKPGESQSAGAAASASESIQTSSSATLQQNQTAALNASGTGYQTVQTQVSNSNTMTITQQENGYQVHINETIGIGNGRIGNLNWLYTVDNANSVNTQNDKKFHFTWGYIEAKVQFSASKVMDDLEARLDSLFSVNYIASAPAKSFLELHKHLVLAVIYENVTAITAKDVDRFMATMSSEKNNDVYKKSIVDQFASGQTPQGTPDIEVYAITTSSATAVVTYMEPTSAGYVPLQFEYDLVVENGQFKIDNILPFKTTP